MGYALKSNKQDFRYFTIFLSPYFMKQNQTQFPFKSKLCYNRSFLYLQLLLSTMTADSICTVLALGGGGWRSW